MLRPSFHFTPQNGWINDPNGLVYDGKLWHLFAQHNPAEPHNGPMHWLHATSSDLLDWNERGVVLAPDSLGQIYSGSAVLDKDNSSALGQDAIVLLYTNHGKYEQQSLAYSNDGEKFTKYDGNPVITNATMRDFRDPKIFRNTASGAWGAVVAAGDEILIYRSKNLIDWEKASAFGKSENKIKGVLECPDLIQLRAPDGKAVWALICSVNRSSLKGGSVTQYFLGEFDGHCFRQTVHSKKPLLLDSGPDNYAAMSFDNADAPIQLGWASNWAYANKLPANSWRGCMTLARRLSLTQTSAGLRLTATPVLPDLGAGIAVAGERTLDSQCFVLELEALGNFKVTLSNTRGEKFVFGCDKKGFYANRRKANSAFKSRHFTRAAYAVKRAQKMLSGNISLRLIFDHGITEIFSDGGIYVNTMLLYPGEAYSKLTLEGANGYIHDIST